MRCYRFSYMLWYIASTNNSRHHKQPADDGNKLYESIHTTLSMNSLTEIQWTNFKRNGVGEGQPNCINVDFSNTDVKMGVKEINIGDRCSHEDVPMGLSVFGIVYNGLSRRDKWSAAVQRIKPNYRSIVEDKQGPQTISEVSRKAKSISTQYGSPMLRRNEGRRTSWWSEAMRCIHPRRPPELYPRPITNHEGPQ